MKKKAVWRWGIAGLALACLLFYFWPMPLSNAVKRENAMVITLTEFEIADGEPHIDHTEYGDMTDEQKSGIIALLEDHCYRRTFETLFSDGSMSEVGDKLLCIFMYEDDTWVSSVFLSETGECSVNHKTYRVENAGQLIAQIEAVCG